MTPHPNETPEPLAGPSVESCATALAEALRRDKGWLHDYADSVVRDAIDRKHLEPLAQGQAGEMPTLPKSLLNTIGEYGMARTDRVSELTIQHRWLRLVAGIKEFTASVLTARLSDIRAALQAKDAEIAGLKADAGRLDWLDSLNQRLNAHYQTTYQWKLVLSPNIVRLMSGRFDIDLHDSDAKGVASCRAAIDAAMKGEAA